MQRGGLRATFDGVVKDVPLGVFTDGQFMQFDAASNTLRGASASGGVTRTGSSADNHVARWDGTGAAIQDGTAAVLDDSANLSGIGTIACGNINGVSITAHAARHLPGGADSAFTGGTFASGDIPVWNGTAWVPKFYGRAMVTSTFTMSTTTATLFDITGLTLSIPRAGNYLISCQLIVNSTSATPVMSYALNCGNVTTINYVATLWQSNTGGNTTRAAAVNGLLADAAGQTANTAMQKIIHGGMITSNTGTLAARIQRSSSTGTVTVLIGSYLEAREI